LIKHLSDEDCAIAVGLYNCFLFDFIQGTLLHTFTSCTTFIYSPELKTFAFTNSYDTKNGHLSIWKLSYCENDLRIKREYVVTLSEVLETKIEDITEYDSKLALAYNTHNVYICNMQNGKIEMAFKFNDMDIRKVIYHIGDRIICSGNFVKIYSLISMCCVRTVCEDIFMYKVVPLNLIKKDLYCVICYNKESLFESLRLYDNSGTVREITSNEGDFENENELNNVFKKLTNINKIRIKQRSDDELSFTLKVNCESLVMVNCKI
jgi:hypothetical protein